MEHVTYNHDIKLWRIFEMFKYDKDPFKNVRRPVPPKDFKFGKDKYVKNKQEEKDLIDEGLEDYYYNEGEINFE